VVGLGIAGAAAAYHLARRGSRVIAFEQFEPGHDRGSSHGESRVIRLAYSEHPSYVPLLRAAYAGWRALEAATGREIMTINGILEAGRPGSPIVAGCLAAAAEHALEHEVLTPAEVGRRFPAFTLPADWTAIHQPDGGWLRPELALSLLVEGAAAAGAEIRTGTRVDAIEPGAGGIRLRAGGMTVEAGAVVIAAGGWIGELVPELRPHLRLTEQVLGWFRPLDPALFTPERFPIFVFEGEEDTCYGFPDFQGSGVKLASHRHGPALSHPGQMRRGADSAEAPLRSFLERHIPAAAGAFLGARTCLYTNTPDEHFLLDRHPDDHRIILASPCSGHGFKFGPVLGDILADLAMHGATRHDISRFRLERLTGLRPTVQAPGKGFPT